MPIIFVQDLLQYFSKHFVTRMCLRIFATIPCACQLKAEGSPLLVRTRQQCTCAACHHPEQACSVWRQSRARSASGGAWTHVEVADALGESGHGGGDGCVCGGCEAVLTGSLPVAHLTNAYEVVGLTTRCGLEEGQHACTVSGLISGYMDCKALQGCAVSSATAPAATLRRTG